MDSYSKGPVCCRLCLTTGRSMAPVASVLWAYRTVLGVNQPQEKKFDDETQTICWECRAILWKLQRFKHQAALAQELLKSGALRSLSKLEVSGEVKLELKGPFVEIVSDPCFIETGQNEESDLEQQNSEEKSSIDQTVEIGQEFKLEIEPKIELIEESEDVWADDVEFDHDYKAEASVKTKEIVLIREKTPKRAANVNVNKVARSKNKQATSENKGKSLKNKNIASELKIKTPENKKKATKNKRNAPQDIVTPSENEAAPVNIETPTTNKIKTSENEDPELKKESNSVKRPAVKNQKAIKKANDGVKKPRKRRSTPVPNLCGANCRKRKTRVVEGNLKKFACLTCNLTYEKEKDRKTHDEQQHPEGAQPECVCPEKKKIGLFPHIPVPPRNPETGTFNCDLCTSKWVTKENYRRHYRGHVTPQCFECDICGKVVSLRYQLHSHMKLHLQYKFLCDLCGKAHRTKDALDIHMYSHASLEARPFKCDLCPRTFITADKLKVHSIYHTGIKDFKCDQCPRAFFVKYELTRHLKKRHGIDGTKFKRKEFSRTPSLVRNKPLYTNKARYKDGEPRAKKHGNGPKYETEATLGCNLCEKKFRWKAHLDAHQVVHTGERPFKCTQCDQRFKFNANVLTHMQSMHTVGKVHECSTCGASFKLKGNLKAHMRLHSDVKPFACDVCNLTFIRKRNLRDHYRVHSQDTL